MSQDRASHTDPAAAPRATDADVASRPRENQRGSVLILALLVTLLILGVGLSVMWVSSGGTRVAGNIARRQEALYAAEAGIERARAILNSTTNWTDMLLGGASAGCTPTPSTQDPAKGRKMCDPTGPILLEKVQVVTTSSATATQTGNKLANIKYTVWIRNDPIDAQGISAGSGSGSGAGSGTGVGGPEKDTDFRVVVRSEGWGRDGLAFVALEAVISRSAYSGGSLSYQQAGINAQNSSSFRGAIKAP